MRRITFLFILLTNVVILGCDNTHNFMDVDNPNAKEDLQHFVSDVNLPEIDTDYIIPESLSGVRNDAQGYVNMYYEDMLHDYVDVAKEGLSGARENLKGYYNEGIDGLNKMVSDKVNSVISGELNKFKIK